MFRTPKAGESFGPYRVERVLGRGGQGVVLEAVLAGGQRVALKLLLDSEGSSAARFRREAQILSQLEHPNLVRVLDHGVVEGVPFVTTELLEGVTLRAYVDEHGPPSKEWVVSCLEQIAHALGHCHARGVIHRDLKPENVLWVDGRPVVIDFGLARRDSYCLNAVDLEESLAELTATGELLGTPAYMAPEQTDPSFGDIGPRTDVYALGGLLFFLLTNEPPFRGASAYNVLVKVMKGEPTDPRAARADVDPALRELCLWTLRKSPGDRPLSTDVFVDALRPGALRFAGGKRLAGVALLLLGVIVAAVVVWALRTPGPSAEAKALLEREAFAEAAALLSEELARAPGSSALLDTYLDAIERCNDRWEEAAAVATRLVVAAPDHPTALRRRAYARLRLGNDKGCLEDLEAFLSRHPRSADALRTRGIVRRRQGKKSESLRDLEAALASFLAGLDPGRLSEAYLRFDVGTAHLLLERYGDALEQARILLEADPGFVHGIQLRARALRDSRRFLESIKVYDEWVAVEPDQAMPVLERGHTWMLAADFIEGAAKFDRYRRALRDFERGARIARTDSERVLADIRTGNVERRVAHVTRRWTRLPTARAAYARAFARMKAGHPQYKWLAERIAICDGEIERFLRKR